MINECGEAKWYKECGKRLALESGIANAKECEEETQGPNEGGK